MLEALRQNSRSAIIYVLFGVLIAAFVISFGPGSFLPGGGGNPVGTGYAAEVLGNKLEDSEYRFIAVALGIGNASSQVARERRMKEFIMDRLIERELLADEARRLGLAVSEEEASEMVANGKLMAAGIQQPVPAYAIKDGQFNYDRFRQVAQNYFGITVVKLMAIQRRELLADKARELLRASTRVSMDDVKAQFEDQGRQANLTFVRFEPYRYEDEQSSDSEAEAYARAHEDEIKKTYEERKALYTKQDKTAHLRRILIEVPKDAAPEIIKAAQDKLTAAQATLKSGTSFADVARTTSEDKLSRGRGGDMGWRKKGQTGLGDDVEKQVFAAKDGDVLGPVRTEQGLELLRVEGFREGDISLEKARMEIAHELARSAKQKERAQKAAADASQKAKAGGKLAEMFPKASDADEAKAKTGNKAEVRVEAQETGLFSRRGDVIQSIGPSAEMAKAVFGKMKEGETLGPLEVSGAYVVATLKERKEPDMAEFDKRKDELMQQFQRTKWYETVQAWSKERCVDVNRNGKIQVNQEVLAYESKDPAAAALPMMKYEPCQGTRL